MVNSCQSTVMRSLRAIQSSACSCGAMASQRFSMFAKVGFETACAWRVDSKGRMSGCEERALARRASEAGEEPMARDTGKRSIVAGLWRVERLRREAREGRWRFGDRSDVLDRGTSVVIERNIDVGWFRARSSSGLSLGISYCTYLKDSLSRVSVHICIVIYTTFCTWQESLSFLTLPPLSLKTSRHSSPTLSILVGYTISAICAPMSDIPLYPYEGLLGKPSRFAGGSTSCLTGFGFPLQMSLRGVM